MRHWGGSVGSLSGAGGEGRWRGLPKGGSQKKTRQSEGLACRIADRHRDQLGERVLRGRRQPHPSGQHHLHLRILYSPISLKSFVNIISVHPHHDSETNLANHPHFLLGAPEALRS